MLCRPAGNRGGAAAWARARAGGGLRRGLRGRSRARARERLAPGGHDAAHQRCAGV